MLQLSIKYLSIAIMSFALPVVLHCSIFCINERRLGTLLTISGIKILFSGESRNSSKKSIILNLVEALNEFDSSNSINVVNAFLSRGSCGPWSAV